MIKKVLAVPDMHLPWVDAKALGKIYEYIEKLKPDVVIQMGDLYDQYSHSKFPKKHDICTPEEEIMEAVMGAETFWKNVNKLMPKKGRCIQLFGNHDVRMSKRIYEKYPEIASIVDIERLYKFIAVETISDERCEFKIDGVIYTHGHFTGLGKHSLYYLDRVVHGHSHRAGVFYTKLRGSLIWELDCGFLADETQVPLQYSATKTTRWTLGFGFIDEMGPRFIAL